MKLILLLFPLILSAQFPGSARLPSSMTRPTGAATGGGTISVVNAACGGSPSFTNTVSVSLSMTSGNKAIAAVAYQAVAGAPDSVKLSDGSSCILDAGGLDNSSQNALYLYHCNVGAGITGATATRTTINYFTPSMCLVQVSGLSSSPFDSAYGYPGDNVSGTTWDSVKFGTYTPTSGIPALILGFAFSPNGNGSFALGASAPYTMAVTSILASGAVIGVETQTVSSTSGTYNPSGTNASAQKTTGFAATYK